MFIPKVGNHILHEGSFWLPFSQGPSLLQRPSIRGLAYGRKMGGKECWQSMEGKSAYPVEYICSVQPLTDM
jgi:hypothetical protein